MVWQINEFVEAFPIRKEEQDVAEMQWKVVDLVSAFFALLERFERDVVALREIHEENRDAQNMERRKARFAWSRNEFVLGRVHTSLARVWSQEPGACDQKVSGPIAWTSQARLTC